MAQRELLTQRIEYPWLRRDLQRIKENGEFLDDEENSDVKEKIKVEKRSK